MALEDISQNCELYTCDRCGFTGRAAEMIEDPASPGLLVHPKCADKLGFNEVKGQDPKGSYGDNYFKT